MRGPQRLHMLQTMKLVDVLKRMSMYYLIHYEDQMIYGEMLVEEENDNKN